MLALLITLVFVVGYLIRSFTARNKFNIQFVLPVSRDPYEVWAQRLVVFGVVVLALLASSHYSGKSDFCANCHSNKKEAKTLAKSPHKKIECLECHQAAGISGAVQQKIDYSRWFWVYAVTNTVKPGQTYIDNGACLRCHGNIRDATVSRYSIKVRHRDFLDRGSQCVDCHNSIAHPGVTKPERKPAMDFCLKCHNDKTAKADCSNCHEKDIGDEIRKPRRDVAKVGIFVAWNFCYRCHEGKTCTQCHGVSMPHPPNWVSEAKHALPAFTNRKVCWRCHDMPSAPLQPAMLQSCACHGSMKYHGPQEEWRKNHGPVALGKAPGTGEDNYCYDCHSNKLCDYCHVEGKYKARQRQGGENEEHY